MDVYKNEPGRPARKALSRGWNNGKKKTQGQLTGPKEKGGLFTIHVGN